MASSDSDAVVCEIRIAARPETVFAFFTDPLKVRVWKGPALALEPRPGGAYRVTIADDVARGEFVEVVPYRRIVFTWGWEGNGRKLVEPGKSTVEIALIPDGDGTIVRLTHRGLSEEARGLHAEGWNHYLPRLAVAATRGDPGPDPWAEPADSQP